MDCVCDGGKFNKATDFSQIKYTEFNAKDLITFFLMASHESIVTMDYNSIYYMLMYI